MCCRARRGTSKHAPRAARPVCRLRLRAGDAAAARAPRVAATGTGRDLDLQTFKLVDQLERPHARPARRHHAAGRAHRRPPAQPPGRHAAVLLRAGAAHAAAAPAATREPLQFGAEIYGHAGLEADLEVLELALASLRTAGLRPGDVDLGHTGIVRALLDLARLPPAAPRTTSLPRWAPRTRRRCIDASRACRPPVREGLLALVAPRRRPSRRSRPRARHCPVSLPIAAALDDLEMLAARCGARRSQRRPGRPARLSLLQRRPLRGLRARAGERGRCAAAATTRSARSSAATGRPSASRSTCANWSVCCRADAPARDPRAVPARPRSCASDPRICARSGEIVVQRLPDEVDGRGAGRFRLRPRAALRRCAAGVWSYETARRAEERSHHGTERRRRRHPVGRRRQGQDRRLADRARAGRRALPGRPQRRPHAGHRRQEDGAAPDPVGHPAPRRAVLHRQRRGAVARRTAVARSTSCEAAGVDVRSRLRDQRQLPADPAVSRGARQGARGARERRRARSAPPAAASARPTKTRSRGARCACRTCSTPSASATSCAKRSTSTTSCSSTTSAPSRWWRRA